MFICDNEFNDFNIYIKAAITCEIFPSLKEHTDLREVVIAQSSVG